MRSDGRRGGIGIGGGVFLAPLLAMAACGGGDSDATEAARTVTSRVTVTEPGKGSTVVRTVTQVATVTQVRTTTQPGRRSTTPVVTVQVPEKTADPVARPTGRPRFRIALTGASSEAAPGRRWSYVVRATARGKPTGGTAKMRVFADGVLVDTIGFFAFRGELRRTHVWPRSLSGKRVILQAEVEGAGGTQRANWPVTVE